MKTCFILVLYLFASIFSGYADLIGIQNDLSTDAVKEKKEESFVRVPLAKSTNLVSQLVKGMLPNSSSTTPAKENEKLQKDISPITTKLQKDISPITTKLQKDISPITTKLDQVNVNPNSKETEVKTGNSIGSTTTLPEIKQGSTVKQQPAVKTKLPQSQEQPAVTTKLPQSSQDATGKVHVNNDIREESSLSEKVKEVSKEDPSNTETKIDVQKTEKQTTRNQPVNTSVASQQRDNERLTYKLLTSQMTTRLTTNFQEIKASTTQYAGGGSTTAIPDISNDKDFLLQSNEEELEDGNKDMLQTNEKDSDKDGTEDGDLDHWNGDNVNLNVDEDINDNDEFWDDDTSDKDSVSNYDYNGDDVTPGKDDNGDNNKIELTTTVANVESGIPDKNLMDEDDSFDDFNSVADKTGDFWDEMTVNKNPLIKDKFVTKNFKSPFAEDMRMFGFYSWVLFITVMLLILFVFFTQQRHRCGMLSGFRFRNRKTSVSSEEGKSLIKNVYT